MDTSKIIPLGITTTVANKAEDVMGHRPTTTTNAPKTRPNETMLSLQWYGNRGLSRTRHTSKSRTNGLQMFAYLKPEFQQLQSLRM